MHYSFRCKTCGHLEHSDNAGECEHPHACRVCGEGVSFDRKGNKIIDKENWEVLSQCSKERLKELGLESTQIMKHVARPKPSNTPNREAQKIERHTNETISGKDKAS